MMASFATHILVLSAILALGAVALDRLLARTGLPRRFTWLAALLGMIAFGALGPIRSTLPQDSRALVTETILPFGTQDSPGRAEGSPGVLVVMQQAYSSIRYVLTVPSLAAARATGRAENRAIGLVWLSLSLAVLGHSLATARRYRRAMERWPRRSFDGTQFRESPATGPALVGVIRPEIVLPGWLSEKPACHRKLVLLHEREHLRARDNWALASGWFALALVPWNPFAWWFFHHLRLSVEIDCDSRVLRRQVPVAAYGSILIAIAERGSGLSLAVPALAGRKSTLERRILAMSMQRVRNSRFRTSAFLVVGMAALVAACETRMPSSADVAALDAAAAEQAARQLKLLEATDGELDYLVDGVELTAEAARAIPAGELTRVEVVRGPDRSEIRMTTRGSAPELSTESSSDSSAGDFSVPVAGSVVPVAGGAFTGLVLIDGAEASMSQLRDLRPDRIESIEVIKGPAAVHISDDPRAADGIIRVVSKGAAAG